MLRFLRCPRDASHSAFTGKRHVQCEFAVELDNRGTETSRMLVSSLQDVTGVEDHPILCADCGAVCWQGRNSISFQPDAGTTLICDFSHGLREPEMTKVRPVVVISERQRNARTCIIVPLGTEEPRDPQSPRVYLDQQKYPFFYEPNWAKCEMVIAVARARLSRMVDRQTHRGIDGRQTMLDPGDLELIRNGVHRAIGLA